MMTFYIVLWITLISGVIGEQAPTGTLVCSKGGITCARYEAGAPPVCDVQNTTHLITRVEKQENDIIYLQARFREHTISKAREMIQLKDEAKQMKALVLALETKIQELSDSASPAITASKPNVSCAPKDVHDDWFIYWKTTSRYLKKEYTPVCVTQGSKVTFDFDIGNVNQLKDDVAYNNCVTMNKDSETGPKVYTMSKRGTFYFASGEDYRCKNYGMRIKIHVVEKCPIIGEDFTRSAMRRSKRHVRAKRVSGPRAEGLGEVIPWTVSIDYGYRNTAIYASVGIILTDSWIVTEANSVCHRDPRCCSENNCTLALEKITTISGIRRLRDFTKQKRGISQIIVHNNYTERSSASDNVVHNIVLMKLDKPLDIYRRDVQPAILPTSFCTGSNIESCLSHIETSVHQDCYVVGWQRKDDGSLVNVMQIADAFAEGGFELEAFYTETLTGYGNPMEIADSEASAPFFCDIRYIIGNSIKLPLGLASHTYYPPSNDTFGKPKRLVYTSIPYHMPWIADQIVTDTPWGKWSKCAADCKKCPHLCPGGVKTRTRECPYPMFSQLPIPGRSLYQEFGNTCVQKQVEQCE